MRSSFYEFRVATSGLQIARAGLNVTSHNVANASNKGYSRQFIEQRANQPLTLFNGRGMYGTGADVFGVGQHRSFFLDKKFWHENSIRGEHSIKASQLNLVETILSGSSKSGLTDLFDNFFATLQDLSQNTGDATYRTNTITSAQTMAKQINYTYESLRNQQRDVNSEIGIMVQVINSLGNQISNLNRQIMLYEQDGSRANDLRDERTRLVDKLSGYVNVTVREDELNQDFAAGMFPEPEDRYRSNKHFTILINGEEFVSGSNFTGLRVEERQNRLHDYDADGLYDIYFAHSGKKLDLYSSTMTGELKGLIDIRDGNNGYHGISANLKLNGEVRDASGNLGIKLQIFDLNKWDFGTNGYIELTDPRSGAIIQATYDDLVYNLDSDPPYIEITVQKPNGYTDGSFRNLMDSARPNGNAGGERALSVTIGKTTSYRGIPHYINKLNELVRNFARALNEGLDADGKPIPGTSGFIDGYDAYGNKGNLFFTYDSRNHDPDLRHQTTGPIANYWLMNAGNFVVNPALIGDPKLLGASDKGDSSDPTDESNNKVVLGLIEIKNFKSLFREGKLSDFILGMASELGIDVRQAQKFEKNYAEIVTYVDNQREQVSGVSLDEEMMAMMKYQHLYQAAAKLVNVIDGIYDTVINRLGMAGR